MNSYLAEFFKINNLIEYNSDLTELNSIFKIDFNSIQILKFISNTLKGIHILFNSNVIEFKFNSIEEKWDAN